MIERFKNLKIYKFLKIMLKTHKEKHQLQDEYRLKIAKVHQRNHEEIHRIKNEFHKRTNNLHRENDEIQRYHRHNRYSQAFIILFNIVIWFLIFRYFSAKTIAIIFAILISIAGIIQFLFHSNLEKRIFKPINKLKVGVDEISKGNYDINIKCDVHSEISILIDSFNDMAAKLQESEKLKASYEENRKTLIANISHDLKTPITSIQGYIETMMDRADLSTDTISKYHQIIFNNASYINKLIDDLFLFSKLDLQKLDLHFESINASAFMDDLMEEFKFELEERNADFHYKNSITQNYHLNIDRKRVHQIFRNIIGNAIKYNPKENSEVNVRLYKKDKFICIDIEDNGPGISEDNLPHIFDRFYRVDYARTKDLMSTGLGLSIAKELTNAHKGKIAVSSKENVGTCFTIMLPLECNLRGED